MKKDTQFESMGVHIRNLLGPYRTVIDVLEAYKTTNDKKYLNFVLNRIDEYENNISELIDISNNKDIEEINWRESYEDRSKI